jgi:hypothetical protein
MGCEVIKLPDGTTIIACSRGRQSRERCACGRVATIQCDWPLSGDKAGHTCDRWCCRSCAAHVGDDRDYCPAHARLAGKQEPLKGVR